jgi:hypothetical protein
VLTLTALIHKTIQMGLRLTTRPRQHRKESALDGQQKIKLVFTKINWEKMCLCHCVTTHNPFFRLIGQVTFLCLNLCCWTLQHTVTQMNHMYISGFQLFKFARKNLSYKCIQENKKKQIITNDQARFNNKFHCLNNSCLPDICDSYERSKNEYCIHSLS